MSQLDDPAALDVDGGGDGEAVTREVPATDASEGPATAGRAGRSRGRTGMSAATAAALGVDTSTGGTDVGRAGRQAGGSSDDRPERDRLEGGFASGRDGEVEADDPGLEGLDRFEGGYDDEVFDDELDDELDEGFDDELDEGFDDGTVGPLGGRRAPATGVKLSRRQKRKEWRRTERARRYAARRSVRFPIFTRSVLLWMLLFALTGMATGGSAAFFWAHFNTQISELREQTKDFDKRSQDARGEIDSMRNQAITDINNQIKPIAPYIAESKTIQLAQIFSPYVWFVATLDENGLPSVGSAFAVAADGDSATLMVTSLYTVRAASLTPSPDIELRKNGEVIKASLVSFDADRDLALLRVARGGMPIMEWASDEQQAQALGLRVFPVSGFGGAGASLTSGVISDQNAAGFLHDARIGTATQGGPIVTADAKVLGVASLQYHPLGFDPGEMHFSIPINQVCVTLMECGGGARRAKTTGAPPAPAKK